MERRNTLQREIVLQAVRALHGHVTADQVFELVRKNHPSVSKGTVYRNLGILAEAGEIRKVEIPDGSDRFDFTLKEHYHVRCVKCGKVEDVDMDVIDDMFDRIHDTHGMQFLIYDILFKGICPDCQE
ncbi:MAG: transcriptional repressor [Dorea sp.]|nr:transcriptional repressor [Dorea sp.]